MPLDPIPQIEELDEVLDDLSSPSTLDVYETLLPYDGDMVAASAVRRALAGGGGGVGPVVVSGTPSSGQVIVADSPTTAEWENPSGDFNTPVNMNQGASVTGLSRAQEVFRAYASPTGSILDVTFDSEATAEFGAQAGGSQGDSITIALVNPGPDNPTTTASTSGNDVTVILATDSGGIVTSQVSDIATAIVNDPDSAALIGINSFSDGLANELAQTPLAGGQDALFAWWVAPNGQEAFAATDEPADFSVAGGQRFHYYDATSGSPALRYKQADADGTITKGKSVGITDDGVIKLANLPTSDPAVAAQLWNDAGVLKVSAG